MYNARRIIPGLIIFLGLMAAGIWYNVATGKAGHVPELDVTTKEKQCVESPEYMRAKHMDLLSDWKESAVREGNRTHVATDGKEYSISLSGTCLDCHSSKAGFCDRCHNYMGVKPSCWACHTPPEVD